MKADEKPISGRGLDGYTVTSDGNIIDPDGNTLRKWTDPNGKAKVTVNGRFHDVASIVAAAFVPNDEGLLLIGYKDGNSSNPNAKNLVWYGEPKDDPAVEAIKWIDGMETRLDYEGNRVGLWRPDVDPQEIQGLVGWNFKAEPVKVFANIREYLIDRGFNVKTKKGQTAASNLRAAMKKGKYHHGLYWTVSDETLLRESALRMEEKKRTETPQIPRSRPNVITCTTKTPKVQQRASQAPKTGYVKKGYNPKSGMNLQKGWKRGKAVESPIGVEDTPCIGIEGYNKKGELVKRFSHISEFAEHYASERGINKADIYSTLRKTIKANGSLYGLWWRVEDESLLRIYKK